MHVSNPSPSLSLSFSRCESDYVSVYRGGTARDPLFQTLCGYKGRQAFLFKDEEAVLVEFRCDKLHSPLRLGLSFFLKKSHLKRCQNVVQNVCVSTCPESTVVGHLLLSPLYSFYGLPRCQTIKLEEKVVWGGEEGKERSRQLPGVARKKKERDPF